MKISLEIVSGPAKGRMFEFEGHNSILVGREKNNRCQILGDKHFSRFHFVVEANPPKCLLRDLGSLNGTFVNDKKIGGKKEQDKNNPKEVDLFDGDIVRCGKTEFKILC